MFLAQFLLILGRNHHKICRNAFLFFEKWENSDVERSHHFLHHYNTIFFMYVIVFKAFVLHSHGREEKSLDKKLRTMT